MNVKEMYGDFQTIQIKVNLLKIQIILQITETVIIVATPPIHFTPIQTICK